MHAVNFDEVVDLIIGRDQRYRRDAYCFVREALDHTQKKVVKSRQSQVCHVTGQELLAGLREFALQQFGPMALIVLEEWGIKRCEDFGEIVFKMVESGLLAKTEKDSRDDFKNGYVFEEAFRQPFLPAAKNTCPAPAAKPA
jgi:uncharacterized repeat protein (TIGR04138 family)